MPSIKGTTVPSALQSREFLEEIGDLRHLRPIRAKPGFWKSPRFTHAAAAASSPDCPRRQKRWMSAARSKPRKQPKEGLRGLWRRHSSHHRLRRRAISFRVGASSAWPEGRRATDVRTTPRNKATRLFLFPRHRKRLPSDCAPSQLAANAGRRHCGIPIHSRPQDHSATRNLPAKWHDKKKLPSLSGALRGITNGRVTAALPTVIGSRVGALDPGGYCDVRGDDHRHT